jgi:signal transduction histidine kinase
LDTRYFGEGNSKDRKIEFNFEYCLSCSLRMLDGKPIMTQSILEEEFERYVFQAKHSNCKSSVEVTIQHSDFEVLQNLIRNALEFGKLRARQG